MDVVTWLIAKRTLLFLYFNTCRLIQRSWNVWPQCTTTSTKCSSNKLKSQNKHLGFLISTSLMFLMNPLKPTWFHSGASPDADDSVGDGDELSSIAANWFAIASMSKETVVASDWRSLNGGSVVVVDDETVMMSSLFEWWLIQAWRRAIRFYTDSWTRGEFSSLFEWQLIQAWTCVIRFSIESWAGWMTTVQSFQWLEFAKSKGACYFLGANY